MNGLLLSFTCPFRSDSSRHPAPQVWVVRTPRVSDTVQSFILLGSTIVSIPLRLYLSPLPTRFHREHPNSSRRRRVVPDIKQDEW